jgi:hypothetical protein
MILLDLGMTIAFPTIVIPKLHNTADPLALNNDQTSWFGKCAASAESDAKAVEAHWLVRRRGSRVL